MTVVEHRARPSRIYLHSVAPEHNHYGPLHGLVILVVKIPSGLDHWWSFLVFSYRYLGIVAANHSRDTFGGASKPSQACHGWNLPIAGVALQMNKL